MNRRILALGLLFSQIACGSDPTPAAPPAPATAAAPPAPTSAGTAPARSPDVIAVAAGRVVLGSRPGSPGRDPASEADLEARDLPAFEIDRLPHPNDPAAPPLTGLAYAAAAARCDAAGKRLCTELEWERACELDEERLYPTGAALELDACRADPSRCASASGVLDLGLRVAEWTASAESSDPGAAIVRGSGTADPARHRCASRQGLPTATADAAIGFRCCRGTGAVDARYPAPRRQATFRDAEADIEALREALRSVPELARFAPGFQLHGETESLRALARGDRTPDALLGWELVKQTLRWSPVAGEEVWVFHGEADGHGLLVALYPVSGGHLHAASFVFEGEPDGVAIAYTPPFPRELKWSTCWGRPGESGVITYDEAGRIVIRQQ